MAVVRLPSLNSAFHICSSPRPKKAPTNVSRQWSNFPLQNAARRSKLGSRPIGRQIIVTAALGLLVTFFANGCFAQAIYQPTSKQQQALRRFLLNFAGQPYSPLEKERPTRYASAFVGLRDNGTPEVIIYLTGRKWCGSGGCVTLILAPSDASYKLITKITITQLPIRVLTATSHGWHDISVVVQSGGIIHPYEADLSFDGTTYPTNPSVPPAKHLINVAPGKVVIPLAALSGGQLLYP